jgi:signal transduction histidine kinase
MMNEKELRDSVALVAHKIKNPLHAAAINLEVLEVKLHKRSADSDLFDHLKIVRKEVQRVQDILLRYLEILQHDEKKLELKKIEKILDKI